MILIKLMLNTQKVIEKVMEAALTMSKAPRLLEGKKPREYLGQRFFSHGC
jgi:hypothetical protein